MNLHISQFVEGYVTRHLVQADGEKGALHLLEQRPAQSMDRAFVTEDANY